MLIIIQIIHVIVSITLILFILLQTGKGSDLGAMLGGGGANTLFGATGATSFLSKLTSYAAVVFVFTCLTLAYVSAHPTTAMDGAGTVMPDQATPAEETDSKNPEEGDWKEKAAANKDEATPSADTDDAPVDTDDAPTSEVESDGVKEKSADTQPKENKAESTTGENKEIKAENKPE